MLEGYRECDPMANDKKGDQEILVDFFMPQPGRMTAGWVWMARSKEYLPLSPQTSHQHVALLHPSDKWT